MPSLDISLPHWAYWLGLIAFPLIAMTLSRRPRAQRRTYGLGLGYFILLTGGMLGLHRFYVKNLLGLLFIPVFLAILFANSNGQTARSAASDADNVVRVAERILDREQERVAGAEADLPKMIAELEAARLTEEEGSFALRRVERNVERAQQRVSEGNERIAEAQAELETGRPLAATAQSDLAYWSNVAKYAFWILLAAMAVDVVLLPGLIRRANANLPPHEEMSEAEIALKKLEESERKEDHEWVSSGWTGGIDRLSLFAGEFVSYWAVIAVFVYYFEVITRYVFNSPTNWAHESMYLMFGMQYLIAGSYAMLTESHVRVDIFYAPMTRTKKAWVDLATSVFFFIFAGTLLGTSAIFAIDANAVATGNGLASEWARGNVSFGEMVSNWNMAQWTDPNIRWGEISFNEWEVPLWPMKWVMVIGGLLLVLQGISKLAQDVRAVVRGA
ncbi:TRAP transporter small permease subunit [Puniceibacterium sediminis]|uniref:TRAP transporter small permease protein n=1 Tax=Puniceibacterium sediminis TaxID=1608407 RepID=A0A238X7H5_9RHOB|nr:TRAP transporter small permease subunit [Puniceibacterium sediminis]SNR54284.1 TRAP-type mannitol/chloroaromatic compound transport system, small permease component [Puniceibacterium sediminis]